MIYEVITGTLANESIGALFAGGIIPGVLMTVLAMGYIFIRVLINEDIAPRDEKRFTRNNFV